MSTMAPSLEDFREQALSWLSEHARELPREDSDAPWGSGKESVAVFDDHTEDEEAAACADAQAWHRTKLDGGWAALTWPPELGGRGLPASYEAAFAELESRFSTPRTPELLMVTIGLVAPTIQMFGTPEQKERFLAPFVRLDELCCQLFSEPGAGSDLAALSCRATRTGDGWVLDGQKVWTSGARQAQHGLLIARSDTDAKHAGLTAFLVPMDHPGVEVRPIRQMTGGESFNEVFFDEVTVADSARVGSEGDGWSVAKATLGFERSISGAGAADAGGTWAQVLGLARHLGMDSDLRTRQALAHLYSRFQVLDMVANASRAALMAGEAPGAGGSIGKLLWTSVLTETSEVVGGMLGPRLAADGGEWGTYAWREHVLGAPGYRIAGGSDEIQRNIIGEQVLGLPREPRA